MQREKASLFLESKIEKRVAFCSPEICLKKNKKK